MPDIEDDQEERTRRLRAIPANTWDQWLTLLAECWAPTNTCAKCIYADTPMCDRFGDQCLFCDAFERDCDGYYCRLCDPEGHEYCKFPDKGKRLDMAISRLEDEDVDVFTWKVRHDALLCSPPQD